MALNYRLNTSTCLFLTPLNISSKRKKPFHQCFCGCPTSNGCPINACAMSKLCCGVWSWRRRHFPALGQPAPDSPLTLWLLPTPPTPFQEPSLIPYAAALLLENQLPEGLGTLATCPTGTGSSRNTPASPKGSITLPPASPTHPHLLPSFNLACHCAAPLGSPGTLLSTVSVCTVTNSLPNLLLPSSGNARHSIPRTHNHSLAGPREF